MIRILAITLIWIGSLLPVSAQTDAQIDAVVDALGLPEMIDIMREEGIDHGDQLAQDMFPDRAEGQWQTIIAEIYDRDRIRDLVYSNLKTALGPEPVDDILGFFHGATGKEAIALEISARRALLDEQLNDANDARVAQLRAESDPRMDLLEEFIVANDLVEANVVGALNSNFAFFSGLADGGAYDRAMSSDDLLREVWSQEDAIREDTDVWIYGFLSMAYTPLSDAQLSEYIDFSNTNSGQKLNTALFEAFNLMFDDVSYALGLAAAEIMKSEAL